MYTINQLDEFLRGFNCIQSLVEIGRLSKDLFNQNKVVENIPVKMGSITRNQTVTQWGLAFLCSRLIIHSNDFRSKVLTPVDLAQAHSICNELNEPYIHDRNIVSFLFRMSQEQFWWQYYHLPSVYSRYKCIFNYDSFFEDNFLNISGLAIHEYFMIGTIILGFVTLGDSIPAFNMGDLIKLPLPSPFKELELGEKINHFLKLNCADYKQFRDYSKEINILYLPKYERNQFNPLFQYPIIKSDRGFSSYSFVVPNSSLLLRKFAEGVYWELRNYFRGKDSYDLLIRFGIAFEKYCGELLKNHFGDEKVKKVDELIGSDYHEKKHADWLVIEDNNIYIFECKSRLLSSVARQTFLRETLRTWVFNSLIRGILQLENTKFLLKENGLISHHNVYKFVLIMEELQLIEFPDFKLPILKQLTDKYKFQPDEVYFITVNELERIEGTIKKHGFFKIIKKKKEIDTNNNPSDGRDFMYISKVIDPSLEMRSLFLNKIFDEEVRQLGILLDRS